MLVPCTLIINLLYAKFHLRVSFPGKLIGSTRFSARYREVRKVCTSSKLRSFAFELLGCLWVVEVFFLSFTIFVLSRSLNQPLLGISGLAAKDFAFINKFCITTKPFSYVAIEKT